MRNRMIVLAGAFVLAASVLTGCSKKEPVVEVTEVLSETVPEVVSETVSEIPSESESILTSEETLTEDVEMPEFILYDENGELYVPQEVTADDIYARIDEIREKYDFANDWQRDRVIGILLYRNSHYMSEEDIDLIYNDYLANFGGVNVSQQNGYELADFVDKKTKIELKDYYIDEKLSAEAEKIENYYRNGDINKFKENFLIALNTVNGNDNAEEYYNPLYTVYENIIYANPYSGEDDKEFLNFVDYGAASIYFSVRNKDTVKMDISDYVSSHQD